MQMLQAPLIVLPISSFLLIHFSGTRLVSLFIDFVGNNITASSAHVFLYMLVHISLLPLSWFLRRIFVSRYSDQHLIRMDLLYNIFLTPSLCVFFFLANQELIVLPIIRSTILTLILFYYFYLIFLSFKATTPSPSKFPL